LISRICLPASHATASLAPEPLNKHGIVGLRFSPTDHNVVITATAGKYLLTMLFFFAFPSSDAPTTSPGFSGEVHSVVTRWEYKTKTNPATEDKTNTPTPSSTSTPTPEDGNAVTTPTVPGVTPSLPASAPAPGSTPLTTIAPPVTTSSSSGMYLPILEIKT